MTKLIRVLMLGSACSTLLSAQHEGPLQYRPITAEQRFAWYVKSVIGPASLAAGAVSAGFSTGINRPEEYGPTWRGFGKRYALRTSGVAVGNGIEAALGAVWGEDPRYPRSHDKAFGKRVKNILKYTFVAHRGTGADMPAYARFGGIVGSNFLSNAWRPPSTSTTADTLLRIVLGIGARAGANAFAEFWPDITGRDRKGGRK